MNNEIDKQQGKFSLLQGRKQKSKCFVNFYLVSIVPYFWFVHYILISVLTHHKCFKQHLV